MSSMHLNGGMVNSPTLWIQNEETQTTHDDTVITLNVGGKVFQALRETLLRYECYFSAHFRFLENQTQQLQQQLPLNGGSGSMNNFLNVYNNTYGSSLSVSPQSISSPIGSHVSEMNFLSNNSVIFNEQQKKKNYIFIDRNPDLFQYVLDCMRMMDQSEMKHCLPISDMNLLQRLSVEASYFSFNEMLEVIESLVSRKKKFASVSVGFDKFKLVSFVNCEGLNSKTSNQLSAPNTISEVFQVLNDNGCIVEHIISRKAIEGFESRIFPKEEHNKALVTIIASYYESV